MAISRVFEHVLGIVVVGLGVATFVSAGLDPRTLEEDIPTAINPAQTILYAPWRDTYLQANVHQSEAIQAGIVPAAKKCPFCRILQEKTDEQDFVLKRCKHAMVMLNKYPCCAGHVLIVCFEHEPLLSSLSIDARREIIELISCTTDIIKKVFHAQGLNVGINLGLAAGASVPDHLHIHILPRRIGDMGVIEVVGQTHIVSCLKESVYKLLKPEFDALEI